MFINTNNTASIVAYIVFTKNNVADLCILFIVLLPSSTILGIDLKSESINTNCDTFLAASLPFTTDILQSAFFNASTSFTPSPVIATVCFSSFSASINSFFCSGVTLPNTVYLTAASLSSSIVLNVLASI